MRAAIGTVFILPASTSPDSSAFETFYYEDQFITDVLVTRQTCAPGIEARQRSASLVSLSCQNRFLAHPGHRLDPGDFAEVEVLRRGAPARSVAGSSYRR